MFCSLALHFAGCKCWARYSICPFKNLYMHLLVNASLRNYSFVALFAKMSRILLSIETNAKCRFCIIRWFGDEIRSRLFFQNDQIQYFIPVSLSKIEFCGVQKQKGKLVFSKSGVFIYGILYPP